MKLLWKREERRIHLGRTWLRSLAGVAAVALVSFQPAAAFAGGDGHDRGGGHGGGVGGRGWGAYHGWRDHGLGGYGSWYGGYPSYPNYLGSYYPSYDLNDYSDYSTPNDSGYGAFLNNDFTATPAPADESPAIAGQDSAATTVQGVRQRARQLSIENRRLQFDIDRYIRANTLTPSEERELSRRERVLRALSDPTVTEIRSGSTLNDLLQDAQTLRSRGAPVEAVVWPSHVLHRVNVTVAGSPGDGGILKDGRLSWPALLRDAAFDGERREIDRLITRGLSEVSQCDADAETLGRLQRAISRLDGLLTLMAKVQGDHAAWSPTEYMAAKDFIRRAEQAVIFLEQPNAEEQLALARDLQAGTAAELVAYMTTHGLQFAPAVPGDERAYMTAYHALADYDTRLRGMINTQAELRSTENSTRRAVGTDGYTGSSGAAAARKAKAAP